MNLFLEVDGIYFGYPDAPALFEGACVSIGREERVLLTGENGCGKSTLLKLLVGLLRPQKGTVSLAGKEVGMANAAAFRKVFFQQQGSGENLFGLCPRHDAEIWRIASEEKHSMEGLASSDPPLLQKADLPFKALSSGELQAFSLLWLPAYQTRFWILDEPTAGLDSRRKNAFIKMLQEKKGLLIVSQDTELEPRSFDRVFTIQDRQIVGSGR